MRQPPSRLTSTQVARTGRSLATASCPGKMIPSSLTTMAVSPVRKRTSTGRAATRDPLSGPRERRGYIGADLMRSFSGATCPEGLSRNVVESAYAP